MYYVKHILPVILWYNFTETSDATATQKSFDFHKNAGIVAHVCTLRFQPLQRQTVRLEGFGEGWGAAEVHFGPPVEDLVHERKLGRKPLG